MGGGPVLDTSLAAQFESANFVFRVAKLRDDLPTEPFS